MFELDVTAMSGNKSRMELFWPWHAESGRGRFFQWRTRNSAGGKRTYIFRICSDRYDCFDWSGMVFGSLFGSVWPDRLLKRAKEPMPQLSHISVNTVTWHVSPLRSWYQTGTPDNCTRSFACRGQYFSHLSKRCSCKQEPVEGMYRVPR